MKNFEYLDINAKLLNLSEVIESEIKYKFDNINEIMAFNEIKVLKAFIDSKISATHFIESTGYGYGDLGREKIDSLYSKVFEAQDSIVRANFMSGTHTISVALFGLLRPKHVMLNVTGTPYPTIHSTIGLKTSNKKNSLIDYGIIYREIDILNNISSDEVNLDVLKNNLDKNVRMVYIQRSKGYGTRPSLSIDAIEKISSFVHSINKNTIVLVDNCYGEFVQEKEPTSVGADVICGSLIKNPGGAIAKCGGYIAGKKELVELCADRLSAPGLGRDVGCNMNQNRDILLGLYIAPSFVGNALKTSLFLRHLFNKIGFKVMPALDERISDIVSVLQLNSKKALISFCEGIQQYSPIDSFVSPVPSAMPGYGNSVIMAAGTFVSGASLELTSDAQVCPPYNVFVQGGLCYHASKYCILKTVEKMINENLININ